MSDQPTRKITFSLFSILLLLFVILGLPGCGSSLPAQTATPNAATEPPALQAEATSTAEIPAATATEMAEAAPNATATENVQPTSDASATASSPTDDSLTNTQTRTAEIDGMVQIRIPAGEFAMGTNDPLAQHALQGNGVAFPEVPENLVTLDAYWIDKFEVSNGQYKKCVDAGVCKPPFVDYTLTYNKYYGNPEFDNYPVVFVNYFAAKTYCEWAGRRLPTEAEWEKAARGTDKRKYPWGNEEINGKQGNFCDVDCPRTHANPGFDDGYAGTAPVGSYPEYASAYGAMDMAGNVWEWTSTIPKVYPYDANDGREEQDTSSQRVWRGGSWVNGYWYMRATARYRSVPIYVIYSLGFRCAESD